jgi:phage terminase small subunit
MAGKLTRKRAAFVREYLKDFNGGNAAIRAGYSERSARWTACELLKDPAVQAAVQAGQRAAAERSDVTVDEIIREYRRIAFSRITDFLTWDPATGVTFKPSAEMSAAALAAVLEVSEHIAGDGKRTVSFRLHKKTDALHALGKHLGMFIERLDVKLQSRMEEMLDAVQPYMSKAAYAELRTAVRAEMGLRQMAPPEGSGGSSGGAAPGTDTGSVH